MVAVLVVVSSKASATSVTLTWTAPSDNVGVVAYAMRYSASAIGSDTTAWWNSASMVSGLPVPSVAGQSDSVRVELPPGTYYFNIVSRDAAMNWSGFSNVAVKVVSDLLPPSRIYDLR